MTHYGVTTDYDYSAEHKRAKLDVWSGPFFSVWEAVGYSLPTGGYMLTTSNGDKVRVACPSPRNGENYQEVDAAIQAAMTDYEAKRGSVQLSVVEVSPRHWEAR